MSANASGSLPIRVLIVDDHPMMVSALVRNFQGHSDFEIAAVASTVAETLELLSIHAVDVVVLDYHLPDGDGASATRQIVDRWAFVKVVMLTGSGDEAAVFEAARAGCSGFMDKTGDPADLVRIVRSVSRGAIEFPAVHFERLPLLEQLVVHYQPIVDLATSTIVGFEALVRWAHPTRGLVLPGEFIALAEHTSFIVDIDQFVREEACLQAAEWNRWCPTAQRRFMSVNLSGRELRLPDLAARIERAMTFAKLEPGDVMIEVTETFLVEDLETCTRRLREVRDLGVLIALDDFGTGYSSLDHLRRLPIDIIKLDKSFTDDLPHGTRALKLVQSVGRLAEDMGAMTEAEGIETAEQADCLLSLGWKLGQGYHFFRPLSSTAIEDVLTA